MQHQINCQNCLEQGPPDEMSKYSVYRTIFWLKQKHFNLLHLPHIYRYFLHQNIFNDWYLAETHLCALQACVGYWALSLSSFRDCSSQIGGRFFDMNKHCVHCLKAESADFFKIGGGAVNSRRPLLNTRCPVGSMDQAYPSCFYFRIWWIEYWWNNGFYFFSSPPLCAGPQK